MRKLLFGVLLLYAASAAAADMYIDTKHLSEADQAKIREIAAQLQQKALDSSATTALPTAARVDEWVQVGKNIGQGLGGAAKELGVAVNDFAMTPVGMLTTAVIVWKFMGSTLLHFVGGLLLWLTGWSFIVWYTRKSSVITYDYDTAKTDRAGRSVLRGKKRSAIDGETQFVISLFFAVTTIVGLITMFSA